MNNKSRTNKGGAAAKTTTKTTTPTVKEPIPLPAPAPVPAPLQKVVPSPVYATKIPPPYIAPTPSSASNASSLKIDLIRMRNHINNIISTL